MIGPVLRHLVTQRAGDRCEYCRLPQAAVAVRFHVEHVLPRIHGGTDEIENLALACPRCNCYKGPNLTTREPSTGDLTELFNPRQHAWEDHFRLIDDTIVGISLIGRATVNFLRMNDEQRLRLRRELLRRREL